MRPTSLMLQTDDKSDLTGQLDQTNRFFCLFKFDWESKKCVKWKHSAERIPKLMPTLT